MADDPKPRIRIHAGSSRVRSADSFQNFESRLGIGTDNQSSASMYGFNPISRNRLQLDWMYRGSWLVRQAIDAPADDMTREGVEIQSDMSPDDLALLHGNMQSLAVWPSLASNAKWARLYGGSIAYIQIEGQNPSTPLRVESVTKGQFKGLLILDRWMVQPSLTIPIREAGPDLGMPMFYDVVADAIAIPRMRIHHSRVIRMDGDELPYWQRIAENGWGLSVIEPLYDRLVAFDSTTQGAAQLVYKAHLRTVSVEGLREILAAGGQAYESLVRQFEMIRLMQTNEGLTLIDAKDKFEAHQYTFSGLSDVLLQFAQQLSGALQIPLTRLFGQSPVGLNATGESDMRNYYDGIKAKQEKTLRRPLTILFDVICMSTFGAKPDGQFGFDFNPLYGLTDVEKGQVTTATTEAIVKVEDAGIISPQIALKELKQLSKITGVFSNITDEDIEAAESEPPGSESADPLGLGPMPTVPGMVMPGAAQVAGADMPEEGLEAPKPSAGQPIPIRAAQEAA